MSIDIYEPASENNTRVVQVHSQNCTKDQNKFNWLTEKRVVIKKID